MESLEEKIKNFLTNIIKIKDWENAKNNPSAVKRLELLRKIVKSNICTSYFQNISMSAVESEERHEPSLEEIIEVGSTGVGGVCIQLNYFLRLVLEYLGYDAYTIACNVVSSSLLDNHVCTVVRMAENELYLVDVACGSPNDEPIPLHKLPFQGLAAGYPYEYQLTEEGIYQRVQLKGSLTKGDFSDPTIVEVRYNFTLEPQTLETFDSPMKELFTDSERSLFLRTAFAFRHFVNEKSDYNFILVYATTVVIGGRDYREVTRFGTYEELVPVLKEYFPKLNPSEVTKAIQVWNQYIEPPEMSTLC